MTQFAATLKLCFYAALVALLLFGGVGLYRAGYDNAEARWSKTYEDLKATTEKAAQDETIRQHTETLRARRLADAALQDLQQSLEAREATIKELTDEAQRDANARRVCLGADSVRRITKATPPLGG